MIISSALFGDSDHGEELSWRASGDDSRGLILQKLTRRNVWFRSCRRARWWETDCAAHPGTQMHNSAPRRQSQLRQSRSESIHDLALSCSWLSQHAESTGPSTTQGAPRTNHCEVRISRIQRRPANFRMKVVLNVSTHRTTCLALDGADSKLVVLAKNGRAIPSYPLPEANERNRGNCARSLSPEFFATRDGSRRLLKKFAIRG